MSAIFPAHPVNSAPSSNTGIKIPILAYHNVCINPGDDPYSISTADFISQLDVLLAYGYEAVTLQDYLDYSQELKTPPSKPVIITFDDGYKGMVTDVLPALITRGMKASFMITTNWIGADGIHLTWEDVAALAAAGMEIGSHSVSHPNFNDSTISKIRQELNDSKIALEVNLPGILIDKFAYPFGEGGQNPAITSELLDDGYLLALDFDPPDAVAEINISNNLNLPRRNIWNGVGLLLNSNDPQSFFMRRVDPAFPLPETTLAGVQVRDLDGNLRTKFVPGESINNTVFARNSPDFQSVNSTASLLIEQAGEVFYDSHASSPSQDVTYQPFPNSGENLPFLYPWQIPVNANLGQYSYRFCLYDEYHLLTYFCSTSAPLFDLIQSPISVQAAPEPITLLGAVHQQVDFVISNNLEDTGDQTYLTVSVAPGLRIADSSPTGSWYSRQVGELINCKNCTVDMQALYEVYIVDLGQLPPGQHTFSLVITSRPGADVDNWLRYRLAAHFVENPLSPDAWYLRWPLFGDPDQQGWYSHLLPVSVQRRDLFLPLIYN